MQGGQTLMELPGGFLSSFLCARLKRMSYDVGSWQKWAGCRIDTILFFFSLLFLPFFFRVPPVSVSSGGPKARQRWHA